MKEVIAMCVPSHILEHITDCVREPNPSPLLRLKVNYRCTWKKHQIT